MTRQEAHQAFKNGEITFEELMDVLNGGKRIPMYGGTFEIHYTVPGFGKMVAYVEAYSDKKSGVRKAAIEKAEAEQHIDPSWIAMVKRYD